MPVFWSSKIKARFLLIAEFSLFLWINLIGFVFRNAQYEIFSLVGYLNKCVNIDISIFGIYLIVVNYYFARSSKILLIQISC